MALERGRTEQFSECSSEEDPIFDYEAWTL